MKFCNRSVLAVLVLCVLVFGSSPASADDQAAIDADRYLAHIRYLASDQLKGRGNGTPGLQAAAEYIARQFRLSGLEPGGDQGTFFQTFEIVTGLGVGSDNHLRISGPSATRSLRLGRDYYPLSVTPTTEASSAAQESGERGMVLPLVFAGYGIASTAQNYDDYADVDVTGKAVLIFTHEPQEDNPNSVFNGTNQTDHSTTMNKALAARSRGASLLVIVQDPFHTSEEGNFSGFLRDPQAEDFGIPVVRVQRDEIQRVLNGVIDLREAARAIDGDLRSRSRPLGDITVGFAERFAKIRRPVRNVIAVLKGADAARAQEIVVVGAHYDHLGLGGRFSLAPDATGQIHNGADDNASGTAALLEMARVAASERASFPRTLVFIAFAGEELGLLGSAYYVNHPTLPLDSTIAMINMDMIGRPSGRIIVSGGQSAPGLEADLKASENGTTLSVRSSGGGYGVGSSDDTSFLLRQIPTIAFFSGFHSDYHRPSDDWNRIDVKGATEVMRIALDLVRRVAVRPDRPVFSAQPAHTTPEGHENPDPSTPARPSAVTGETGYGPYFGSVPDFAEESAGVKFAAVREGSPAANAGLLAGDVLISFGGTPIRTLVDFTAILRTKRPGDRVDVVVVRSGKEVRAQVELAVRR